MAVVISNGATTLATAGGFYRVEAHNLGMMSATQLALSSTRTIPVTFANAGNCKGIVLALSSASASSSKSVTVVLQENVASVWTDRTSVTLTAAQISNSAASTAYATWITPFVFGTPYAVTTAASTWRFSITQGAGTNNWQLKTSDATNPSYATWCDNAVSYASGDVPIAKDKITIDMDATFTGVAFTGGSNSVCAWACTSSTPTPASVAMFEWENAPAASYKLNINGYFIIGAHSGFRAGTADSPIPYTEKANIIIKSASIGTTTATGFYDGDTAAVVGRQHLFLYGEIPANNNRTTLASDAATAQQDIVTTDSTGWSVGDAIVICKSNAQSVTTNTAGFTIETIAGTAINVNTNILTATRKSGGHVFRLNGYGVYLKYEINATSNLKLHGCNSLVLSGVQIENVTLINTNGTAAWYDDAANITSQVTVEDCSVYNSYGTSNLFTTFNFVSSGTLSVQRNNFFRVGTAGTQYGPNGGMTFSDNVFMDCSSCVTGSYRNQKLTITGNYFYNSSANGIQSGGIALSNMDNNVFWGVLYAVRLDGAIVQSTFDNNTIDYASVWFLILSSASNFTCSNNSIGVTGLVSYLFQIYTGYAAVPQIIMRDTNIGTITSTYWPLTGGVPYNITNAVDTSYLAFQNYDLTTSDDRFYMPYGEIQRTKAGLSDTTVRTSGGSAMRFMPTSSTNLIHWEQTIPTGDITSKTMTITCWVYINNAAYYAGTHTKPTLTVTYDDGASSVTSVATATAGSWQQLACTFTPATSYGQVTMKITGGTDATGTNRYFYIDDFNIAYPAGVQVNLGGLDLWADGIPVAPAIATMPSITGVWDEPLTAHTVSGSFGAFIKKLLTVGKFLGLK